MQNNLFNGLIAIFVSITVSIPDITLAGNNQSRTWTLQDLSCIDNKLKYNKGDERAELVIRNTDEELRKLISVLITDKEQPDKKQRAKQLVIGNGNEKLNKLESESKMRNMPITVKRQRADRILDNTREELAKLDKLITDNKLDKLITDNTLVMQRSILEKLATLDERRIVYICLSTNDLQTFTEIRGQQRLSELVPQPQVLPTPAQALPNDKNIESPLESPRIMDTYAFSVSPELPRITDTYIYPFFGSIPFLIALLYYFKKRKN